VTSPNVLGEDGLLDVHQTAPIGGYSEKFLYTYAKKLSLIRLQFSGK